MKKTVSALLLSCTLWMIFLSWTTESKPQIVNSGYNQFVTSPYSCQLAVTTFDSHQGIQLFERSRYKTAFFKLAPHYSPQQNILTCGVATSVILLNTIYANTGRTPPISINGSWYDSDDNAVYGLFTWNEENYFNDNIKGVLNRSIIMGTEKDNGKYSPGLNLDQLTLALNKQGLKAMQYHVQTVCPDDIHAFRTLVKKLTVEPVQYLAVNYSLKIYTPEDGGHFSLVAAYEESSDSVLILDTWAANNAWIWIKLTDLYKGMNTLDGKYYRGYVLVDNKI